MGDKAKRSFGTLVARHNAKGVLSAWQARYRSPLNNTVKVQRNFPPDRKADAERWLNEERELVEQYRAGERAWIPPSERTERKLVYKNPDGLTFGEYSDWYCRQLRNSRGEQLSPLTMGSHKAAIRDLDQTFGNSQLLDIRQADIDRWFDAAQASMSPYRLRRATMMLRRVFNAAVTDGLGDGQPILPSNPCRIDTPGRDLNSRNERPLTVREARELAEAMPAHLRLVVWLGLTAGGLHMGEICALRLGDIDTEHHLIHINSNVVRKPGRPGYGITEAYRPRGNTSPLPGLLEPAILRHAERYCPSGSNECFLFPVSQEWRLADYPNPAMLQANLRKAFQKIGRPAGTYRTMRATYALTFLRNGGTMQEAMDMLGYATTRTMSQLCSPGVDDHVAKVTDLCSCDFLPPDTDENALGTVIDDLEHRRTQLNKTIRRLRSQQSGSSGDGRKPMKEESRNGQSNENSEPSSNASARTGSRSPGRPGTRIPWTLPKRCSAISPLTRRTRRNNGWTRSDTSSACTISGSRNGSIPRNAGHWSPTRKRPVACRSTTSAICTTRPIARPTGPNSPIQGGRSSSGR